MKKRLLGIFLCLALVASIAAGCGNGGNDNTKGETTPETQPADNNEAEPTDAPEAGGDETVDNSDRLVAFSISYTGNDFMQGLANAIKGAFESRGYKCEVASADGDATNQIEQIENFVTMGAEMIIVMGVDPTGLTDVGKRAIDAGTAIVSFTTQIQGGETTYVGSASEAEIGGAIAELGSNWVDATFPDAADGEVEVVIFGYSGTPEAALRSEAIKAIEENSKVNVTYMEPESNTLDAAQQAAENLFQTNPETKLILCYNSGMCNGVNAYVMSGGSAVSDKSQFATFGSDISDEVISNILASVNDESVVRGCVSLGDFDTIITDLMVPCEIILNGGTPEPAYYGSIELITPDVLQ